jgi:hypothetical protein
MEEASRSRGITTFRTSFGTAGPATYNPWNVLSRYWRTVRQGLSIVHECNIDLIHGNAGSPAKFLVAVARISRLPLIEHLHTAYGRRERYFYCFHLVNRAVGVAPLIARSLLEDGMPHERVLVIPNAVAADRLPETTLSWRRELDIPQDTFIMAAVGYLVPQKG